MKINIQGIKNFKILFNKNKVWMNNIILLMIEIYLLKLLIICKENKKLTKKLKWNNNMFIKESLMKWAMEFIIIFLFKFMVLLNLH